tara:strand:+ start:95 stop:475 length:381 start_codon:yes stop_codon:yes gene_type:complete
MAKSDFKWKPKPLIKRVKKLQASGLNKAAGFLTADIKKSFVSPAPSRAGQAPAVDTGTMKRSITWDVPRKGIRRVGTTLQPEGNNLASYPMYLELGTKSIAPRPWLRVALARNKRTLARLLAGKGI